MMKKPACPIIAIEEHYWDPELAKHYTPAELSRGATAERLYDFTTTRIKEMDEAGIDMQVLALGSPGVQLFDPVTATSLAIPVMDGQLALGTWQGVFLWEHRHYRGRRNVIVHVSA